MLESATATEKPAILPVMILQLENALTAMPAPDYVREAGERFVEALKRWANGK